MKNRIMIMTAVVIVILGAGTLVLSAFGQAKTEGTPKEVAALAIARGVIGTGVENNEPVGAAQTFPVSTEKVYCFIEATNIPKDLDVTFVWSLGGKEQFKIALPLKMGPRWRTYALKNLHGMKGDWKVEIKDADGKLLKDVAFKVE